MNKIQIMILGNNEMDIAPIMQQLENTSEWEINAFTDKENAVKLFQNQTQDVIVFSNGFDKTIKKGLENLFRFQEEDLIVFTSINETDVWNEVNNSLHQLADSKRPSYSFVDDALKDAKFNITIN